MIKIILCYLYINLLAVVDKKEDWICCKYLFHFLEPPPPVVQVQTPQKKAQTKVVIPLPEESENVTRWIVDQNFRREQERLKIPFGKLY